jgi:hypothetical protein
VIAERDRQESCLRDEIQTKRALLADVRRQRERAERNLALADGPEQYRAIAAVFEELRSKERRLDAEINTARATPRVPSDLNSEVSAALDLMTKFATLAGNPGGLRSCGELFARINVRLFFRFASTRVKKRVLNLVAGGTVTFGNSPPPIPLYAGPTGRRALRRIRGRNDEMTASRDAAMGSGTEGKSFGNVTRGDKTAIELFIAGIKGWETGTRRSFAGKPEGESQP